MELIQITAGLIVGILLGKYIEPFYALCFGAVLLIEEIVRYLAVKRINTSLAAVFISLCVGVILINHAAAGGALDDYVDNYCEVTGSVVSIPKFDGENYKYELEAVSIKYCGIEKEIDERIILTAKQKPELDDCISANGFIKEIKSSMNEYGFDARRYYKSKDIEYKMYSESVAAAETDKKPILIMGIGARIKNKISKLIYSVSSGDNAAVLDGVLTGNRGGISEELTDTLVKSGAYRFLYCAYFFVIMISLIIGLFSDKLPAKLRTYMFAAAILLVGIFNSDRPVFVKAGIYLAAISIINQRKGFVYRPDALCAVISAMLVSNPLIIYNGGFGMSAAATGVILLFGDMVKEKLLWIKNNFVRTSVVCWLLCSVALLPLAAYYFNGIAPYSLLLTFVCIPANAVIWICFFPAAAMIKLFGSAPVLSQLISAALFVYKRLPEYVERLPLSYIYLATPSVIIMLAAAAALYALYRRFAGKNPKPAGIAAAALAVLIAVLQIFRIGTVEMTFVNVGQGDGAVVSVPFRGNILIDGGGGNSYSKYNPGKSVYVPYLISHGKTKIDAAFISHYHADHAEGIIAAIRELDVKAVFMPGGDPDNELRIEAENAAAENGTKIYYITEDTRIRFDSGLTAEIIVPDERTRMSDDENDTSLLINVIYGDINCLFTGDMTTLAENSLLMKDRVPEAEILKVAHHGSATSTSKEWVEAVDPDISVISLGKDNMYGFPKQNVIDNLSDTEIYRTDLCGDITITADKHSIKSIDTYQ